MKSLQKATVTTCALAIIRDTIEFSPSSRIVCATSFTSFDDTLSTRFEIRSAIVPLGGSREQAFEHIAKLVPLNATAVLRAPRMPRGLMRHIALGGAMPAPIDAQALTDLRSDLDVHSVCISQNALDKAASRFGFHRADPDDPLAERARRSGEEAQALYLAHLLCIASEQERDRLGAAFQAWASLRKAAPLGAFGAVEEF